MPITTQFTFSGNSHSLLPVTDNVIDPSKGKVNDAIMKHSNARGTNTMEFPVGKFAGGAKVANTMVKTIDPLSTDH